MPPVARKSRLPGPGGNPTVSIIIVSYNTRDMTLACVRSIYEQAEDERFEVIVIDNASSDGSADAIAREYPQVQLIRSKENLGFARANNLAATHMRSDYLLLLNPDTLILDHAVDRLVAFARDHPDARIWGGRTLFGDGSLNPTSCWRFMSVWSLFCTSVGLSRLFRKSAFCNRESYEGWQRDRIRQVDIVTGCFLLTERGLWEMLGGFDDDFFMYAEEADLCYRARQFGALPLFTPHAVIVHYGGASEKVRSAKISRLYSGKVHFLCKHWSPVLRQIGIFLFKMGTAIRTVGYGMAALLLRTEKCKIKSAEWNNVWLQRHQWSRGYGSVRKAG